MISDGRRYWNIITWEIRIENERTSVAELIRDQAAAFFIFTLLPLKRHHRKEESKEKRACGSSGIAKGGV